MIHQQNHRRLIKLRRTAASLEDTIKSSVKLLSDARQEIRDIPSYRSSTEDRLRDIRVDELLSYAKFISKTTVPPTPRKQDAAASIRAEEKAESNGTTTSLQTNGHMHEQNGGPEDVKGPDGAKTADDAAKADLNAAPQLPFVPWPPHEVIRQGALGAIQVMVEQGQDPASILTAEEQAEVDRLKKEEEERELEVQAEAERRRMNLFDTGVMRRRATGNDVFNPDDL